MNTRENGPDQEPVIRDNRKIDPETGEARTAAGAQKPSTAEAAPAGPESSDIAAQLAERTADLQRVQAEYANYRKRVERDRAAVREQATAAVLAELLPVLDDIGRAREHGELTGGFAKVSEALEATLSKFGLVSYGAKGDPFDPMVHEALMHSYSSEVTESTCVEILQPGYRLGDRIIRPARVAVADPAPDAPTEQTGQDRSEQTQPAEPAAEAGAAGEAASESDGDRTDEN
ncbi:nucleotide exchange factor GrpE [Thermostaphylospora chromogena]|uniref:Protein GrpE n=1 Tax=Thermostaphylospora chromogena TaxID=35622 RepID=A0A1H1DEU0_9ACTN|nr:nucleotide exchange factor GrpE [Thermostaphylospora chromogena]SDQ74982.1 molecular chaperone GrpE [Thermostaphylospora chromogena]